MISCVPWFLIFNDFLWYFTVIIVSEISDIDMKIIIIEATHYNNIFVNNWMCVCVYVWLIKI